LQLKELNNPALKALEREARETPSSKNSGSLAEQKQLDALQKSLEKSGRNPDALDKLADDLKSLQKAMAGLPKDQSPAADAARQKMANDLADLAQQAAALGQPLPNLDDALAALKANKTDDFQHDMEAAATDVEKLHQLAKTLQQLQQQSDKLGKNLPEQLKLGQPEAAQQTLNKMIDRLKSGQLTPEQLKKILDEVSRGVDPAAPYGKAAANWRPAPRALNGIKDIWRTMKVVARHRVLLAMTVLVGAASFFVGNAYQAQMPGFARDLNVGRADLSYSALLAADACGGLIGGILLESRGLLQPRTRTAFVLAMIWCLALAGFARANSYALALCLLFIAGFVELAFNSMAQALVQLNAPNDMRGGVIGVFSMSAMGLRTFSGLSVGLLGSSIGIHYSLSYSACALLAVIGTIFIAQFLRKARGAAA